MIWGERVFLTSSDPETAHLTIHCFATTDGSELWHKTFESAKHHLHRNNTYASSTIAADEKQIYATFANEENTWLVALNHDGQDVWKRNFGPYVSTHGFGLSPSLVDDKVVLIDSQQASKLEPGQQPGISRVIAVNKTDGANAWETPITDKRACYGVPCQFKTSDDVTSLIGLNSVHGFFSIDPKTGEINWTTPGTFEKRIVASPLIAGNMVFASEGSGGGGNILVAMKLDLDNPKAPPQEAYRIPKASYVPSPVVVKDLVFMFSDKGILSCHDRSTGEEHYRQRIGRSFSGSPVATSTHVYCIAENGDIHVVDASKTFGHRIADRLNDPSRSTPAITGNRIYFRTEKHLWALGEI